MARISLFVREEAYRDGMYAGEEVCAVFSDEAELLLNLECKTSKVEGKINDENSKFESKGNRNTHPGKTFDSVPQPQRRHIAVDSKVLNFFVTLKNAASRGRSWKKGTDSPVIVTTTESDDSTCVLTSYASSQTVSVCSCVTSIKTEAPSDCNHDHPVDQWVAAKRGDYSTLLRIAKNSKDSAIWTKEDEFGNVPLYYACHSGGANRKYGLMAIALLVDVWPGEIPKELLERCKTNSINRQVSKTLVTKSEGVRLSLRSYTEALSISSSDNDSSMEDVLIEGLALLSGDFENDDF